MICQRCAKERGEIHTCTPSDLVRKLEQQRDELLAAAENLIRVKGRHHTEQAYKQLEAALEAAKSVDLETKMANCEFCKMQDNCPGLNDCVHREDNTEPVAWRHKEYHYMTSATKWSDDCVPLYTAPQPAIPKGWREELELIRAVLDGFKPCMAKSDGLRAVHKLLAAAPKVPK